MREEFWSKDICFLMQRTARVVARRLDSALRPWGLTHGQFILLAHISQSEGSTMTSLASLLAMDRTTITAALKRLEMSGLVTTQTGISDRRTRQISVSVQGRSLLKRTARVWKRSNIALVSLLQPNVDLGSLCRSLDRLSAGVRRRD